MISNGVASQRLGLLKFSFRSSVERGGGGGGGWTGVAI